MFNTDEFIRSVNRRSFLKQSAYGVGGLALSSLLGHEAKAAPGIASKAKRVIHLCMAGGPSHLETLDWKPELRKLHGQTFPESFTKGQQLAQLQGARLLAYGPQHEFRKFGKSGQNICGLFEKIGSLADDICIVRSMVTEQINHDTAHAFMNSGSILKSRPSMGSWLLYGLGSMSENLPGFVVLVSVGRGGAQPVSARQWSAGFLPGKFQGVQLQTRGDAVHYVGSPEDVCQSDQRLLVVGAGAHRYVKRNPRGSGKIRRRKARRRQLCVELSACSKTGRARRPVYPALPPGLGPPRGRQGGD
jgi:hypothetical protein